MAPGYRRDCSFRALATGLADTFSLKTSKPKTRAIRLGAIDETEN
jgi:hypothetical protein